MNFALLSLNNLKNKYSWITMRITKKQKEAISDSIKTWTKVAVMEGYGSIAEKDKKLWDCGGYTTKKSDELKVYANIINVEVGMILKEIFHHLGNEELE